jgi:hypothetical protein
MRVSAEYSVHWANSGLPILCVLRLRCAYVCIMHARNGEEAVNGVKCKIANYRVDGVGYCLAAILLRSII